MSSAHKVALIGTVGLPAKYGGFETLVHYLVSDLGQMFDFTVYCSGPDYSKRSHKYLGAHLRYLPFRANGAQSIPHDFMAMIDSCFRSDLLVVLGVSGGLMIPLLRLLGKRVILNIGGLDWQRSKWGWWASCFLRVSEAVAVKAAQVLVADNAGIASYLKAAYGKESVLIEYGGDQVSLPAITPERLDRYPFVNAPYAFSVARIQADNNIEMILEAFSRSTDHVLVLVGNWSRSAFGVELKARFSGFHNLHLLDAIYDPEELNTLRGHCSIYIHGHSAGGTNPSLVEAMHLSLPIAAFDVVYNRLTTEGAARYFKNGDELAAMLNSVSTDSWNSQREVMKEIGVRRYRWSIIADKYAKLLNA